MNTILENIIPFLIIILVIWTAVLTYLLLSYLKEKKKIVKEIKNKGLQDSIEKIFLKQNEIEQEIQNLQKNDQDIGRLAAKSITKIGTVRYNPFSDTGGDQSFSVAMLNLDDNGIVITSLYGRGENKVYAKSIKGGQSKYHLTEEENEAIKRAKNIQK